MLALSILTLNIWGIPFISKDRDVRVAAIAEELSGGAYDVVSLQEVWSLDDFDLIRQRTIDVLPYSHYFHSGVFGSGLCILSKYRITGTLFHAWSVNGYVHRVQHGDWFGGKGVGLCKLDFFGNSVHVYIAHLHAEYDRERDDYKAHRVIQAFDTAQFIAFTRDDSILQVLAGDLNTEPGDLAHRILLSAADMTESCDKRTFCTNECPKNSYTTKESSSASPYGKRIDYILYRAGANAIAKVIDYSLPFPSIVSEKHPISYSDHEAVKARITVDLNVNEASSTERRCPTDSIIKSTEQLNNDLNDCIHVCDESFKTVRAHRMFYWTAAAVAIVLLAILMDAVAPNGLKWLFIVFRVLISGWFLFNVAMATLWNSMEHNAALSGRLAMEIALNNCIELARNVFCVEDAEVTIM